MRKTLIRRLKTKDYFGYLAFVKNRILPNEWMNEILFILKYKLKSDIELKVQLIKNNTGKDKLAILSCINYYSRSPEQ